jgi:hypothetical protein
MSQVLAKKDAAFMKTAKGFIHEVRPGIVQRIRVALGNGKGNTAGRAAETPFPMCMAQCGTVGIAGTGACKSVCPGKRRSNG